MPRKNVPVPVPGGYRYCFRCAKVQRREAFNTDRRAPSGLASTCRSCVADARRGREQVRMLIEQLVSKWGVREDRSPFHPSEPPSFLSQKSAAG